MQSYSYIKTPVNFDRLTLEIQSSSISIVLDKIESGTTENEVLIYFRAAISTDEKTLLDAIVLNHSGEPLPSSANIVTPTSPLNEHTMQPCGCTKASFKSRGDVKYVCDITLSEKSQDGLTFTYNSDVEINIEVGNYVFQNNASLRSWVTEVDYVNHKVTFELPVLDNGTGVYSKGHYQDMVIPNWNSTMYLWGVTVTVVEKDAVTEAIDTDPCSDFIELSVVDVNDLFLMDSVCRQMFGVDAADAEPYLIAAGFEFNGEYGHWTKYYDESWIMNINGTYTNTPDGAPAQLLSLLALRLSFFTTENENHIYEVFTDYYLTVKD